MTEFEKAYHETLKHAEWCGQSQFIVRQSGRNLTIWAARNVLSVHFLLARATSP